MATMIETRTMERMHDADLARYERQPRTVTAADVARDWDRWEADQATVRMLQVEWAWMLYEQGKQ